MNPPSKKPITRREFHSTLGILALGVPGLISKVIHLQAARGKSEMKMDLTLGKLGFRGSQWDAIDLARRHGFQSVGADTRFLAQADPPTLDRLRTSLGEKRLQLGAASLPVDFRHDDPRFRDGLRRLPQVAAALEQGGVDRVTTWLSPAHDSLTYRRNFHRHQVRLREVATILGDHRIRLGLEFVGTQSLRNRLKYPFVHTMQETLELIDAIGTGQLGLVMDCWHWWTAGDTAADILRLKPSDVVTVELNDAPTGRTKAQQIDSQRELPMATGVIDLSRFLNALNQIGFDGPVLAEPFNRKLRALPREAAVKRVADSLRKALALID